MICAYRIVHACSCHHISTSTWKEFRTHFFFNNLFDTHFWETGRKHVVHIFVYQRDVQDTYLSTAPSHEIHCNCSTTMLHIIYRYPKSQMPTIFSAGPKVNKALQLWNWPVTIVFFLSSREKLSSCPRFLFIWGGIGHFKIY